MSGTQRVLLFQCRMIRTFDGHDGRHVEAVVTSDLCSEVGDVLDLTGERAPSQDLSIRSAWHPRWALLFT